MEVRFYHAGGKQMFPTLQEGLVFLLNQFGHNGAVLTLLQEGQPVAIPVEPTEAQLTQAPSEVSPDQAPLSKTPQQTDTNQAESKTPETPSISEGVDALRAQPAAPPPNPLFFGGVKPGP